MEDEIRKQRLIETPVHNTKSETQPIPIPPTKTGEELLAEQVYGDRALSGPNALYRSCKDWGG